MARSRSALNALRNEERNLKAVRQEAKKEQNKLCALPLNGFKEEDEKIINEYLFPDIVSLPRKEKEDKESSNDLMSNKKKNSPFSILIKYQDIDLMFQLHTTNKSFSSFLNVLPYQDALINNEALKKRLYHFFDVCGFYFKK